MKMKRCTASACRREFEARSMACPHCGKVYPRSACGKDDYALISTTSGTRRLIIYRLSRQQAEDISRKIREEGINGKLVGGRNFKKKKGVFVLTD